MDSRGGGEFLRFGLNLAATGIVALVGLAVRALRRRFDASAKERQKVHQDIDEQREDIDALEARVKVLEAKFSFLKVKGD